MTWAVTTDLSEPVEVYDAVHRLLLERTGGVVDGRLVHLTRPTADGFRVLEVWESREAYDRYGREVVAPLVAEFLAGRPHPPEVVTEFAVLGLVVPAGGAMIPAGAGVR
ncbi:MULTISPECIES: hypothetical protein [unclassified Geodermatophilus]